MSSYDTMIVGAILIISAIVLHSIHYFLDVNLENDNRELLDDKLNDKISQETYDSKLDDLRDKDFYYDLLNLLIFTMLYSGIATMIYAVYKKGDENTKIFYDYLKRIHGDKIFQNIK